MRWGGGICDIEIGKMSKSNMIKYCRDEWIVIPTEVMRRLRGKEKGTNLRVLDFLCETRTYISLFKMKR